mmetsp:Transcript_4282/g.4898  ORF Transcript_4282/g.4898 Transcript_4282/m.4898 type:complete len:219 (-) Transcript_4282:169-825(-)
MKTNSFFLIIALALVFTIVAGDDDTKYVTCGSAVKITHAEGNGSEYNLASDNHHMNGSGSGQQLVTSSPDLSKTSSLWMVRSAHATKPCNVGDKIPYGSRIRLTHLNTNSNLHSHLVRSPLSNQQEVSGYGNSGEGDSGDDWVVQPARGSEKFWEKDQFVYFQHADTGMYLGSTEQAQFTTRNCGHNCPVMNHLEVFARKSKDSFTKWKTSVGVFLYH